MVGMAESFALFFAVKQGLPLNEIALLSTVPILLGSIAQWTMPIVVPESFLRRAKLFFYWVQIVGLFLLCWATFQKNLFPWLFAAMSLYWIGGLSSGPFWLEWIAKEVPAKTFSTFLSKRNAFVSFCTLLAYISSAAYLNSHSANDNFLIVFSLGTAARFASFIFQWIVSSDHIAWKKNCRIQKTHKTPLSFKPIFWMIVFTVIFKFTVNLSSPFFLPYMIKELNFGILEYVALTSVPFLGRFLFLAGWGRASTDLRPFVGLQISCIGIAIVPALWVHLSGLPVYFGLELLSGILWGGFELCTILIIQRFLPNNTLKIMGLHMSLMSAASVGGALTGSWLMKLQPSYTQLFMVSTGMRMLVAVTMVIAFLKIPETRTSLKVYGEYLSTALSLRPSVANVGRLLWPRRR